MQFKDWKYSRLIVLLAMLITSCSKEDVSLADTKKYETFLGAVSSDYYTGVNTNIIYRVDSFYAQQASIPAYYVFKKYMISNFYYYDRGQYVKALNYVDSGINLLKKKHLDKKHRSEYIDALNIKGKDLYATMNYSEAYNYYFKAKLLAEELKDPCVLDQYVYQLGMAMYNQKKYEGAITYFRQGFLYTAACKESRPNRMQEYLDNIALCFEKLQVADSALYYYDSALSYIDKYLHQYKESAMGVVYGNKGSVYLSIGKTDSAIIYLRKSYTTSIQPGYDQPDALLAHLKLARAYLRANDVSEVSRSLPLLVKELDTIRHPIEADFAMQQLMYDYYTHAGKPTEALKYYKNYNKLKDSIWNIERRRLQSDVTNELNQKQQKYDIAILQKQNQLSAIYLFVIVAALLLAIVIVVLVYMNYKKTRKNVQVLTALNNQVLLQKTELEKKNKEKDRILHVVAHDLRSPISGALYTADMILREDTPARDAKVPLGMMQETLERALKLINELLNLSAEGKTFTTTKADIVPVVEEAVKSLQYKAKEKQQIIRVEVSATPVYAVINAEKINRVMNNLIMNAIKFSPVGRTIKVVVGKTSTTVLVSVMDNGIGIPESLRAGVFDMFTASQRHGTGGETSYGLGLSICKQIIELLGGRIWFETEEGKGTTFYFELPRE